jgi:hypothetical protein
MFPQFKLKAQARRAKTEQPFTPKEPPIEPEGMPPAGPTPSPKPIAPEAGPIEPITPKAPAASQAPKPEAPGVAATPTEGVLERIDAALKRMKKAGATEENKHYQRLKEKRDLIASGKEYKITDVTEKLIAGFGGQIGRLTKATLLRRPGLNEKPKAPAASQAPKPEAPGVAATPTEPDQVPPFPGQDKALPAKNL